MNHYMGDWVEVEVIRQVVLVSSGALACLLATKLSPLTHLILTLDYGLLGVLLLFRNPWAYD
jgi:hypothetical protein